MEEKNYNEILDFGTLLSLLRKNIWKIIFCGIMGFSVFYIFSLVFLTPKYNATIDLLVNQRTNDTQEQVAAQQTDLQAINTYKDVLKKDVILTPVLKEVTKQNNYKGSLTQLQNSISIDNQTDSQVISVTVTDSNAYTAADIANTVGKVFTKKIKNMMKVNNVTVVTNARPDTTPVSPNKHMNGLIGLFLGLVFYCVVIVSREYLDKTVKSAKFLTDDLKLVNLGKIFHMKENDGYHVVKVIEEQIDDNQHFLELNSKETERTNGRHRRV